MDVGVGIGVGVGMGDGVLVGVGDGGSGVQVGVGGIGVGDGVGEGVGVGLASRAQLVSKTSRIRGMIRSRFLNSASAGKLGDHRGSPLPEAELYWRPPAVQGDERSRALRQDPYLTQFP